LRQRSGNAQYAAVLAALMPTPANAAASSKRCTYVIVKLLPAVAPIMPDAGGRGYCRSNQRRSSPRRHLVKFGDRIEAVNPRLL